MFVGPVIHQPLQRQHGYSDTFSYNNRTVGLIISPPAVTIRSIAPGDTNYSGMDYVWNGGNYLPIVDLERGYDARLPSEPPLSYCCIDLETRIGSSMAMITGSRSAGPGSVYRIPSKGSGPGPPGL